MADWASLVSRKHSPASARAPDRLPHDQEVSASGGCCLAAKGHLWLSLRLPQACNGHDGVADVKQPRLPHDQEVSASGGCCLAAKGHLWLSLRLPHDPCRSSESPKRDRGEYAPPLHHTTKMARAFQPGPSRFPVVSLSSAVRCGGLAEHPSGDHSQQGTSRYTVLGTQRVTVEATCFGTIRTTSMVLV